MAYVRPPVTKTDQLTKDQIAEKLKNYIRVSDMTKVPLNTHLRYYTKNKEGHMVFRLGGFLLNNSGLPKYVVLTNNKTKPWSVQMDNAIFFRKLTPTELEEQTEKIIIALKTQNKELKEKNKELKIKLKQYVDLIKKLKKAST